MSFRIWFKRWCFAFFRILNLNTGKHKSERRREEERRRRLKAKYSDTDFYPDKKRYVRRSGRHNARNKKLVKAILGFMATSLAILLLPFGLIDWGCKSVKTRHASKRSFDKNGAYQSSLKPMSNEKTDLTGERKNKEPALSLSNTHHNITPTVTEVKSTAATTYTSACSYLTEEDSEAASGAAEQSTKEQDLNTPKSTPKNEKDKYIRKRMIVAGSYYCDKSALDALKVGAYLDLEAEPEHPYDKDAVKLTYSGKKIGYIAKQDRLAFVTCLKLKNNIYGVITEINNQDGQKKYEFEAWFDSTK